MHVRLGLPYSTSNWWIGTKFLMCIHDPQKMYSNNFGDFWLYLLLHQQTDYLLDILPFNASCHIFVSCGVLTAQQRHCSLQWLPVDIAIGHFSKPHPTLLSTHAKVSSIDFQLRLHVRPSLVKILNPTLCLMAVPLVCDCLSIVISSVG